MVSVHSVHEGTISAKPFSEGHGRISGADHDRHGGVEGPRRHARIAEQAEQSEECAESPQNSAAAELSNLISSLGSLSAQAQGLPMTPPSAPSIPQSTGYRPQVTDYTQLAGDAN